MKKVNLKLKKIPNIKFLKKYNYDINQVIGVKNDKKFILYVDKKLIRIYRGNLKSSPLLSTYIPIEDAIFYNFEIEKSVLEKVEIESFIETKVYEEAGIDEAEDYDIKFKIIDKLKDDKKVSIEVVIVPIAKLNKELEYIIKQSGYIDYVSFPAFSYKALYEEEILKKANDLFVVLLKDKIYITLYADGDLVSIITLTGGLERIYDSLKELKIRDFNFEVFKKLLLKKGLSEEKYFANEVIVLEKLKQSFRNIVDYLNEEINRIKSIYNIEILDRIFITSEYGDIKDLDLYLERHLKDLDVSNFEFYEKYNLDRLPVDPFLFLSMLEAHYAYKYNNQNFNFSHFLRKPTFFYRPSGIIISTIILSFLILSSYPFYIYLLALNYEHKIKQLNSQFNSLSSLQASLNKKINMLSKKEKEIDEKINKEKKEIKTIQNSIFELYKFKFAYIPKSKDLVDITYLLNQSKVYVTFIKYENKTFSINVYSYKESNIPHLIKSLVNSGFDVSFDKIILKDRKYISTIRIFE